MGANFAARRRLFDAIGGFDEILGGGGPLRSSQDYDLAYRTYRAGRVILLRPEVTLRHDGRREAEDWPALLLELRHRRRRVLHQARALPRSVRAVAAPDPAARPHRVEPSS